MVTLFNLLWYTCALSCADVFLCAPILIHELFCYPEPTYSENHSVWRVMTSHERFLFLLDNLCYSCTCLAPPQPAFQLFAGQTIQLLYFCTKNKVVVVVVVVALLPVQLTNSTVSLNGQFSYMNPKPVHYLLVGKAPSYFCVMPITVILNPFNAVPCLARNFCPISMVATKKTQIYNNAVALIFKYCTLRMKTWNSVNFFLICKACKNRCIFLTLFFTRAHATNTFSHGKSVFMSYLFAKQIFNYVIWL